MRPVCRVVGQGCASRGSGLVACVLADCAPVERGCEHAGREAGTSGRRDDTIAIKDCAQVKKS